MRFDEASGKVIYNAPTTAGENSPIDFGSDGKDAGAWQFGTTPTATPTFTQVDAICSGGSLSALPTTSNNAITGTWSPALNNSATTTYTFTPSAGQSAATATMTIEVNTTSAPASESQTFCGLGTVANLVATGTAIKWYAALTGGTALASTTALTTGTTYYASQTIGTCESTRTAVAVTITPNTAPTAVAQTFCTSATVANLVATGTAIKWYAASTGGTALANTTALISGTTYYASQTIGTCESTRTAVNINVNPTVTPTFTQVASSCANATLTALPTTSNNGISGTWSPALNNTTTTTYTFTPTVGQCANTTTQTITITTPKVTSAISFVAPVASIGVLNVGSATITGTMTNGIAASGVNASIPYTGGNGISYAAQTISSTGVSGLTATLLSGVLANGAGSLLYTISGTPSASGTVSFTISIGGQSGTFTIPVAVNLVAQYPTGSVFCDSTPTAIVDVTNPITGKTWMDRNLGASQAATSTTDLNAQGDLYQWGRRADGHQCRNSSKTGVLSILDQPSNSSFVLASGASPYDWRNPQNHNLWQGVNGINNPCPSGYRVPTESELEAERASFSSLNSNDAFSSLLKFTISGYRNYIDGSLKNVNSSGYYWSSTVTNSKSRFLMIGRDVSMQINNRSIGHSVRCIKQTIAIGSLNCENATVNGNVINGQIINNVSINLPYSSGNGDNYQAMTLNSTGVSGLIASISSGQFNNGSGNLTLVLSGTPAAIGEAFFDVNIGGQICSINVNVVSSLLVSLYPSSSIFCNGPTKVVEVLNPTTGKIWMDRNLGASQVAISSTDINSFGDLYQWGRKSDGHQCRSATTTSISSATDQALNGSFILSSISPYDWRSPQNINLWQGVNGINNPCPLGYRLPTQPELNSERITWVTNTSVGAFLSPLKLPMAGTRDENTGLFFGLDTVGGDTYGNYWSSNFSSNNSTYLNFYSGFASFYSVPRGRGFSVRCIKN